MSTTPTTGNPVVDEFLKSYDFRISDACKSTPPASKERLRKMRPAILLLATNEPAKCEAFISVWIKKNLP